MTVLQVPLIASPSQELSIRLGQQSCRLRVYQKRTGLYLDLLVNDLVVAQGILCCDRVWLIRDPASGFVGDFTFIDTQGASAPDYTGLAGRYQLVWNG
ncbi:hypothetical protein [Novosphingobium resinovorum]|uniref:Cyanophage baseplate Pam3 plug gp18 domain-containing protein n=1 Tax=Novosphingobium resinovorum TaxID=158500 RepID=A0A1D8A2I0_9SPHN|nr:hypothetical protein [Novosphingobium resinovorum]AOR76343.1 hypothetical protein BES08_05900 [Novosphingobium resinovorum]